MNIARNAVKYTDAGSIRLEARLHDGRAEIRVVDSGIGIAAEALPRVSERFYRGEGSREGFGLGLSIVQAALEVMDGELDVASEGTGRGTTVRNTSPPKCLRTSRSTSAESRVRPSLMVIRTPAIASLGLSRTRTRLIERTSCASPSSA